MLKRYLLAVVLLASLRGTSAWAADTAARQVLDRVRQLSDTTRRDAVKSRVAPSIKGECQAPETFKGTTRAPSALAAFPARATMVGAPEITVCSGVLKLARAMGPSLVKGCTSPFSFSGVKPMTATMAPGYFWASRCMRRPRSRTAARVSPAESTPAANRALYSPKLWPHTAAGVTLALAKAR